MNKELSETEYSAVFESARLRALAQAYGLLSFAAVICLLIGFPHLGIISGSSGLAVCVSFIALWKSSTSHAKSYFNRLPPGLLKTGYVPGFWLTDQSPALAGVAFLLALGFALWRQTDFQGRTEARLIAIETKLSHSPTPTPNLDDATLKALILRIDKLEKIVGDGSRISTLAPGLKTISALLESYGRRLVDAENLLKKLQNPDKKSKTR